MDIGEASVPKKGPTFAPSGLNEEQPFDRLVNQLRALSDNERVKGSYLEQVARHFLTVDPLWADQLGSVWLWKDWPGRDGKRDTGIDLVAEIQGGGLLAVQVKFYAERHRIQKGDLDSFFEAIGRAPFTEGLVIDTTSGAWSVHAEEALKNRSKPVRRVSLDELRHSSVDWTTYALASPATAPKRYERKVPRPHQHKAISAVIDAFTAPAGESVDRGKLIMACGTGKTFTALKLAERWTRERTGGASTILFMVPSLALLQQTLTEWSAERDPEMDFQAFAVGSDVNIGRQKNGDITSVMLEDLGAPATTNGTRLADLIETRADVDEGMTVVFSTYQSIEAVAEAQRLGAPVFDLVICDEAHRTTGVTLVDEDESHFVKVHDNDVILAEKRVYMTATPRIFAPEVKNTAREKDAELVSMDDENLYGPVLFRIGFHEAVQSQLLTDYKVVVLGVSEDQIVGGFQRELAEEGHELQIGDVAKLVGCYNALAKRDGGEATGGFAGDREPMRRAVAFARDIKTSKKITNDFELLADRHLSNVWNEDPTDDLTVQTQHVDGTMNATQRGELLDWLKAEPQTDRHGRPVARVLTNARCLSEGVDVPNLDAVLFLHPRKSQVDVVQAVGRVMRRAKGKRLGYIVLPIAIPAGMDASEALNDNDRYKVVWQVLQALRAHDERLDTAINQAAFTGTPPEQITVVKLDLTKKNVDPPAGIGAGFSADDRDDESGRGHDSASGSEPAPAGGDRGHSAPALFPASDADEWKDAVYAKLVKKVGDRMYWDDWAGDIGEIAKRFIALVTSHVDVPHADRAPFDAFVKALRSTVNPDVAEGEAIELLAQHLITKPVFEAMFPENTFTADNPVSVAMESVLLTFDENQAFAREREPLETFYAKVTERIRGLETVSAKQQMLVTLYDKFFTKAFPLLADRMGIVFTPVPVVDYILRSADAALHRHFGKRLSDEGVNILEPFVGTGTFLTRLMQTGLIRPDDLSRKYTNELFANEIVLLSYYIAAVNIESVYRELCAERGIEPVDGGFAGISLTDTFAMDERDSQLAGGVFPENTARLQKQRTAGIDVIVMNPPYRTGQASANDGAQNAKYSALDADIRKTYAALSTSTNKNRLYDSYYRALRWATDRIHSGVVVFVSNSGFIDSASASGVRLSWQNEFHEVFVYNLRGAVRGKKGEVARREGGNVFDIMTGVAITVLVKNPNCSGSTRIWYRDIGDDLTREEKLDKLTSERSIESSTFDAVALNSFGDWVNRRDERYIRFPPLGAGRRDVGVDEAAIFSEYSNGVSTNRDAWVYNFDLAKLKGNVDRHASHLNSERLRVHSSEPLDALKNIDMDPAKGAWPSSSIQNLKRNRPTTVDPAGYRCAAYRPFNQVNMYFDASGQLNHRPAKSNRMWPTPAHRNRAIVWSTDNRIPPMPLMTDRVTDLNLLSAVQMFPRHMWEASVVDDGAINFDALAEPDGEVVDGYRRVDNITDATLARYREAYRDTLPVGDTAAKDDIFYAVYALLHHPTYRETYAADLQKMLPRIPLVEGFAEYARIGRALADLHIDYENVEPYPLREVTTLDAPTDAFELYRINKLAWASRKDRTSIRYNAHLKLEGIPEDEALYKVGGRSPLEWVLDRYQVKTDKKSGIVNDPNAWLREHDNPRYVVDLIKSLVTVSLETQLLIAQLPDFVVIDGH